MKINIIYTQDQIDSAYDFYKKAQEKLKKASLIKENKDLIVEAISLYEKSLRLYPKIAGVYIDIAYICTLSSDNKTSLRFIETALSIDPFNEKAIKLKKDILSGVLEKNQTVISFLD